MVEVVVPKHYGLCRGANESLEKAREIGRNYRRVYTFGKILNNNLIVNDLKNNFGIECLGVGSYKDKYNPNDIQKALMKIKKKDVIIITAHGLEKEVISLIKDRAYKVFNLTCQKGVTGAQKTAEDLYNKGYGVVFITTEKNRYHPETRGIISYTNNNGFVLTKEEDIYSKEFNEFIQKQDKGIGIIAKTTEEEKRFENISDKIRKYVSPLEVKVIKTICNATKLRQITLMNLLKDEKELDAIVVVGDETSANTMKLVDIAKNYTKVYLALDWNQLKNNEELKDFRKIGVTAGASAYPDSVDEVIENLKKL